MPDSCFVEDTLVNIHTMWLHVGSFIVSIYLLIIGEVKPNLKYLKSGIVVFLVFLFSAESLNIIVFNSGVLNEETFNMFYISPYFKSTLPIFEIIQHRIPYLIFLLSYILVVIIGAYIVFLIVKLCFKSSVLKNNKYIFFNKKIKNS